MAFILVCVDGDGRGQEIGRKNCHQVTAKGINLWQAQEAGDTAVHCTAVGLLCRGHTMARPAH